MKDELVYLACPYTHQEHAVKTERWRAVNAYAASLMARETLVFSPISHTHPIAMEGGLPGNWEFWEKYDRKMMACCTRMVVLCLGGWSKSTGVKAEVAMAEEMGLPIFYERGWHGCE